MQRTTFVALVASVLLLLAEVVPTAIAQSSSCTTLQKCTTPAAGNCNAAAYSRIPPTIDYMICCMPAAKGTTSANYGDGTGCVQDTCTTATTRTACMAQAGCVPTGASNTNPSVQCIRVDKICWVLSQSDCNNAGYCAWSTTANACFTSTKVVIMLIFLFVSLVAAIVIVAVVVVVNQRKAEREALEEEEAAAASAGGGHQL
jgi:hypothetical protein